jgi:hypothetical protein
MSATIRNYTYGLWKTGCLLSRRAASRNARATDDKISWRVGRMISTDEASQAGGTAETG